MQGIIQPDNVRRMRVRRQRLRIPEGQTGIRPWGKPLSGAQQQLLAMFKPDILNLVSVEAGQQALCGAGGADPHLQQAYRAL